LYEIKKIMKRRLLGLCKDRLARVTLVNAGGKRFLVETMAVEVPFIYNEPPARATDDILSIVKICGFATVADWHAKV
jgi:hypothetical protein